MEQFMNEITNKLTIRLAIMLVFFDLIILFLYAFKK